MPLRMLFVPRRMLSVVFVVKLLRQFSGVPSNRLPGVSASHAVSHAVSHDSVHYLYRYTMQDMRPKRFLEPSHVRRSLCVQMRSGIRTQPRRHTTVRVAFNSFTNAGANNTLANNSITDIFANIVCDVHRLRQFRLVASTDPRTARHASAGLQGMARLRCEWRRQLPRQRFVSEQAGHE